MRASDALRAARRGTAGAGLVEVLVAVSLTLLVLGGVVQATNRGLGAFREGAANNEIEARAARAMSRLARELLGAGAGTLQPVLTTPSGAPTVWSSVLEFRVGETWDGDGIGWSEPRRLIWERAAGELDNGADDDGDGVADQGALILVLDPGAADERRVVLASGVREQLEGELANGLDDNANGLVDEGGLAFDLTGDVLTVRFSLERSGPGGRPIVRTQQTSIRLRNTRP